MQVPQQTQPYDRYALAFEELELDWHWDGQKLTLDGTVNCTPPNILTDEVRSKVKVAVQGNLDPLALIAGGEALANGVRRIISAFEGRPHVFNLGHGILPDTPIAHIEQLLELVRR